MKRNWRVALILPVAGLLAAGPSTWMTRPVGAAQMSPATCSIAATPSSATPAAASAATPHTEAVAEQGVEFDDVDALLWQAGDRGVVLAHGAAYDAASWRPQAETIARAGVTALAVEQITPEAILAGIRFLREACGASEVTLIGASAGGGAALTAVAREPEAIDRLILLSATGDVAMLGDAPKLFVASEGEGMADSVRRMAEDAPGTENEALILPGDAHAQAIFRTDEGDRLLEEILDRLDP